MKKLIVCVAAATLALPAQEKKEVRTFNVHMDTRAGAGDHVFVASGMGPAIQIERFMSAPVKGAPYAAEASTESIQTLADGNRIISRNTSKMYRDSEGRTRMENTIAPAANWTPAGKQFSITSIMDPVAKVHYTLENGEKIARKMTMPDIGENAQMKWKTKEGKDLKIEKGATIEREVKIAHSSSATITADGAGPATMVFRRTEGGPMHIVPDNVQKEDLGKQTIEGVVCEGTRTTMVIPAGQLGNEREIRTVTERWYSPELGFDVLRKHSDPRAGETTYKVTAITRIEQPRSLFEVPSDYKVEEMNSKSHTETVVIKRGEKE